jgi:hypothetical protein
MKMYYAIKKQGLWVYFFIHMKKYIRRFAFKRKYG